MGRNWGLRDDLESLFKHLQECIERQITVKILAGPQQTDEQGVLRLDEFDDQIGGRQIGQQVADRVWGKPGGDEQVMYECQSKDTIERGPIHKRRPLDVPEPDAGAGIRDVHHER